MPPYGRHHLLDARGSTASSTFSMRFPDHGPFLALLVLAALPLQALAGAEQVRADIASRVRSQYPALSPAELASGSAAFDPTRQALAERNNPVPGAAEAIEADAGSGRASSPRGARSPVASRTAGGASPALPAVRRRVSAS